jgi:dihydroorotase
MDLCLRGGRVIDPGRGVDAEADVILKDGVVARSGKGIAAGLGADVRVIDVRGKWVVPGSSTFTPTCASPATSTRKTS